MAIAINGSGTVTGISVGGLPDGIVDTDMMADGAATGPKQGAGSIIQVVQAVKTDTASHDTNTWTDISGLSLSITPSSASNKILISFHGSGSTTNIGFIRLLRDSTEIGSGGSAGSRIPCACMFHRSGDSNLLESFGNSYLDSPSSTSAVTYKLQWRDESGAIYLNRSINDTDSSAGSRTSSVITAMEVAG